MLPRLSIADRSALVLRLLFLILSFMPGKVLAQVLPEQIIQQEQQRLEQQQREIEAQQRDKSRIQSPRIKDVEPSDDEGTCFDVRDIQFSGNTLFDREELQAVVSSYRDKCLGPNQLGNLLNTVTSYYFNKGYVTSKAYLPEQNLSDGSLTIQIVEGVLEGLLDAEFGKGSDLESVFNVGQQELLNLRDLEQGLENINRLQSYRATMKLLPGTELGQTRVEVAQQVNKPWQLQLKSNNSGQESTGEQQLQGLLSWDNPLGLYDFSYLSYQTDTELSRDERYSESLAFHWDRPIGYWSIGLDLTHFQYKRPVQGNAVKFSASGETQTQKLSIGRVVSRDRDSKTRIKWALTRKQTESYVEDVKLDVSSRILGLSDLTLQHEQYFPTGAFLLSEVTYTRGLDAFGSPNDGNLVGANQDKAPKAQFDRYNLLLDYRRPFQWLGQSFQYKTQWKTQYSPDVLFGSEQISIGSLYTVRGYKASSLSGDSGSYWRNDLSWIVRAGGSAWAGDWLNVVMPYVGLDAGRVRNINQDDRYRSLKGWTLGVLAQGKGWNAELSFSNPLGAPGDLQDTGEELSFSLNITL